MITIRITADAHGKELRYANKATRYVQTSLIGTVCETVALREVVSGNKPNLAATLNLRAPGDWPS
jgi:hypothetical protein